MIGLQTGRETSAQAHSAAKPRNYTDFLCHQNEVLHAHDLRYSGRHLRCQSWRQSAQTVLVSRIAQQPITKATHSKMANSGKRGFVMGVDDEPSDLIALIGNQYFIQEVLKFNVG